MHRTLAASGSLAETLGVDVLSDLRNSQPLANKLSCFFQTTGKNTSLCGVRCKSPLNMTTPYLEITGYTKCR